MAAGTNEEKERENEEDRAVSPTDTALRVERSQAEYLLRAQPSEIDRLRLKVPDRDKLLAEIERLTAKAENWQRIATEITASEHAQRLDNERLRAALQEAARRLIANGDGYGANEATRASEPKP